jgi:hypothetical protein
MTPSLTFIVRVAVDEAGRASGIVERVRTGAKQRFEGFEALGPIIASMVRAEGQGRDREAATDDRR